MYNLSGPVLRRIDKLFGINAIHMLDSTVKQKRESQIEKVYMFTKDSHGKSLFNYQLDILRQTSLIRETQVLGINEIAVGFFVDEYKELYQKVKEFKEKLKVLKQFHEISIFSENEDLFKKDLYRNMLYNDLNALAKKYGIDVDYSRVKEI